MLGRLVEFCVEDALVTNPVRGGGVSVLAHEPGTAVTSKCRDTARSRPSVGAVMPCRVFGLRREGRSRGIGCSPADKKTWKSVPTALAFLFRLPFSFSGMRACQAWSSMVGTTI